MSFFNNKQLALQRVSPTAYLEIDSETSISYYIVDPGRPIVISTVEYKVSKLSGRDVTSVIPWTAKDIAGITDDIYQFDITITGVVLSDTLQLTIKVTDADGMEYYHEDTEVTPI